jgi:NAD(P)-dependent dehydrogenase (short-subunit alcohol dehydrogenase family)
MSPLEEKVALVTGAAVRVGHDIALAFARAGCDIVVHYRDSEAEASALADEIRGLGREAWLVQGDLSAPAAAASLMREAWDAASWIDILVNNAACYPREPLASAEPEDFEHAMRVNAFSPIMLAREMSRLAAGSAILPEAYRGQIINILDRDIVRNGAGRLPYWLSKKTLEAATLGLAAELAPRFAVNAVAPGPVLTADSPAAREPAGDIPLVIRPTPSDVAECALFLARSTSITGQIIFADGGQHLGS